MPKLENLRRVDITIGSFILRLEVMRYLFGSSTGQFSKFVDNALPVKRLLLNHEDIVLYLDQ